MTCATDYTLHENGKRCMQAGKAEPAQVNFGKGQVGRQQLLLQKKLLAEELQMLQLL